MVLPAVLGALSNPWVLSTIGTILPSVISALTGSPTEEEAKAKVAPERERLLGEFEKAGVERSQAEHLADEAVSKGVHEAMNEGGVPPWLEGVASIAGGIGGFKAGQWLKSGKAAAGAAAKGAAAVAAPAVAEAAAPVAEKAIQGPFAVAPQHRRELVGTRGQDRQMEMERAQRGELDQVGESRLPAIREERGHQRIDSPFTGGAAPMTEDEVAFWKQRLSPRQGKVPRRSPDPVLNIGEDEGMAAGRRAQSEFDSPFPRGQRAERTDPYTGRPKLPHEDLEIDPLTGAPIWNN